MYAVEISTLLQIAPFICFNNYSKSNKSSTLDVVRAPLTELVCEILGLQSIFSTSVGTY